MTVADIAWPSGPAASTQQAIPVFRGLDAIPENLGPTVLTLGVFDGVHRGHARLITHAVGLARRHELPSVLVTFDPHPARVLGIARDTSTLTTIPRRAALAAELGVDAVVVLPFDRALASLTPKDFVDQVLADRIHARAWSSARISGSAHEEPARSRH
jgi:riboflavin kinase/FMN adenylyltransferase